MITNKIAGWLLLFLGVAIIFYSLYSSFNIFTAKTAVPEIFSIPLSQEIEKEIKSGDVQAQAEEMIKGQLKEMIPVDFLPGLFNLISWSILAGILIFGGSQIANLGIKLIRK